MRSTALFYAYLATVAIEPMPAMAGKIPSWVFGPPQDAIPPSAYQPKARPAPPTSQALLGAAQQVEFDENEYSKGISNYGWVREQAENLRTQASQVVAERQLALQNKDSAGVSSADGKLSSLQAEYQGLLTDLKVKRAILKGIAARIGRSLPSSIAADPPARVDTR